MSKRKNAVVAIVAASVIVAGCEEKCENGFKVKTEYKYATFSEFWHESPKDDHLDGATRVSTSTYKNGRSLTLRCFKGAHASARPVLDLRYTISVPLLAKLAPIIHDAI